MPQHTTEPDSGRQPVGNLLTLREITELLIRHYGLKDGHYEPSFEFTFNAGQAGPSEDAIMPTAFVAISRMGLVRVDTPTKISVDAGTIPKRKKKEHGTDS